ncbi:MAG: ATP synthase subunit I [Actinomycetota bacterium]
MASDVDPAVRFRPAPDERPIEALIGKHIAKRALYVAPVLALIFGVLQGWPGVIAALIGTAIVVINFVLGGYILAWAARVSLQMYHAAALFGFFIRLGLITVSMLIIANVTDLDRMALGISVVASYLVLLTWEAAAIVNGAERDLEWSN